MDRTSLIGCSMKALGCSVLLILWACCGAQDERSKCGPLPLLHNGDFVGISQASYPSGATVEYKCQSYHKIVGNNKVTCLNGAWSALPECLEPCTASPEEMAENNLRFRWSDNEKVYTEHGQYIEFMCLSRDYIQHKESPPFRIKCNRGILLYPKCIKQGEGSKCGPLPPLPNGDIVGIPRPSYPSGTTVEYKCQSYHKILGNNKVTCLNGAWSALPECLEPCTASPEEMAENNLRFRWMDNEKAYTEHGQYIEFICLSTDYIQHKESPPFRIKCNRGILLYPKCIKQGSCTPSSTEMDPKNIIVKNGNTEIKDGTMAEFACKPGFYKKPNEIMTVMCIRGNLEYPECDHTPPVCSRPPLVPHGKIVGDVKNEYNLDSSVEYICDEDYALEGTRMLTCNGGRWSGDVPQCIRPCQVTKDKLEEHFVELSLTQRDKTAFKEGDTIIFRCKPGFRVLTPPGILVANCTKDGFTYPTCINPTPCRVSQEGIDFHNLELVGDKILFHHEDTIQFGCKPGYFASLTGTCKNSNIMYPTCLPKGSCMLKHEEIEQNNIKLLPAFANLLYATDYQTIEFSCKQGYIKHASSSDMSQVCEGGIIAYPTCIRPKSLG